MASDDQQPRQSCPQCTLWGTSVEEIRLRHELLAAGVPIDATHEVIHAATGKVLQCALNLAVIASARRQARAAKGFAGYLSSLESSLDESETADDEHGPTYPLEVKGLGR